MTKQQMVEILKDFNNYKEITRGLYRSVISAGACYEIMIIYHSHVTDILTAQAIAYSTGDWSGKNDNFFQREQIGESPQPVQICIDNIVKDFENNVEID